MAKTETVAETYDCDHGKCNVSHTVPEGARPPGIELTVTINGVPYDVYAHGRSHVGPAVLAVMDAETPKSAPADEPEGDDEADLPAPGNDLTNA